MQRGRYIRTCMDGFLIEVLRVTSSQVCFKNMPAKVIDEMHQAPSPVVSLVNITMLCLDLVQMFLYLQLVLIRVIIVDGLC